MIRIEPIASCSQSQRLVRQVLLTDDAIWSSMRAIWLTYLPSTKASIGMIILLSVY